MCSKDCIAAMSFSSCMASRHSHAAASVASACSSCQHMVCRSLHTAQRRTQCLLLWHHPSALAAVLIMACTTLTSYGSRAPIVSRRLRRSVCMCQSWIARCHCPSLCPANCMLANSNIYIELKLDLLTALCGRGHMSSLCVWHVGM